MSDNVDDSLTIKVSRTGHRLRLTLPAQMEDEKLVTALEEIAESDSLSGDNVLLLDFQNRACSDELISGILFKFIQPHGFRVAAWITSDADSSRRLASFGFHTDDLELVVDEGSSKRSDGDDDLILRHSLRSGQCVNGHENVVLIGHLNRGAEIHAGRSITVFGKLSGVVHAGLNLNVSKGVYVIAWSFEPQQMRFGDKVCTQFGPAMRWWKKPVIVTLEDEKLLIRELKVTVSEAV